MRTSGLTIYHFPPSPPSRTAVLVARYVDVPCTIVEIDLFEKEQLTHEELLEINPQHCLPTINDNGWILWESRAIAGYFARQFSEFDTAYPKNPQLKALVDQRLYFDATTLWPRLRDISFNAIFLGERTVPQEKKDKLNEAIAWLEKFLHGRQWLAGNDCTIADLATYTTVSSIAACGWNLSAYPAVQAWLKKCREVPGADENEYGAQLFGEKVISCLDPGQID